jgi:predicted DsbA family dithiol-disulfide isomerase
MIIEVYADLLCGWAYIGKRRLEQALDQLGDQLDATVIWRPYLIDPTAPSPSVELATALTHPAMDAALQQAEPGVEAAIKRLEVGQLGIDLGIGSQWNPQWRASSWAAHRLAASTLDDSAEDLGADRQNEVVEAILHAHFVEGLDINSLAFLRTIAHRFDLPGPVALTDTGAALAYLQAGFDREDPVERRTREAQLTGQAIGVATSPTFVVNGVIVETGAQAPETLAEELLRASLESDSTVPDEVQRFRNARALLEARNPLGCLYLLAPLRPEYDGLRGFETLTARALAASASLEPARAKLEELLERYPDDAYLQVLMGKTLKRMQDPRADKHLALARAMNPEYLDF